MLSFTAKHTCLSSWTRTLDEAIRVVRLMPSTLNGWCQQSGPRIAAWVESNAFEAKPKQWLAIPDEAGHIDCIIVGIDSNNPSAFGELATELPQGVYQVEGLSESEALSWVLQAYRFETYLEHQPPQAQLYLPNDLDLKKLEVWANAIAWGRDLINRPAQDLSPAHLEAEASALASAYSAAIHVTESELAREFPAIHAVGRAASTPPRLIECVWGNPDHYALTLVGKGVCFDTGGLNLKTTSGMLTMKKDMGGAAHVLVLARVIMALELPIYLRVLVPAVENSVSGNAYRPGDILTTRSGKTVEIGNTDAEGRLILCDALTYAQEHRCDWLIDIATLTGAARVALGTDLPAFFSNESELLSVLMDQGQLIQDAVWPMPLYAPYRALLESPIADLNNVSQTPYGGAITAALFLESFINSQQKWMHFDLMAENTKASPGRPKGGEIMGMRALFELIQSRCQCH